MKTIKQLGTDDFGTLYSVHVENLGLTISMYVNDDGTEYTTTDWQDVQPQTIEEMADYEWVNAEDWQWIEN